MSYKTYETYKNSNVEWIGDIPQHWQTNRFKIVFSYSKGKNPQTFFDDPEDGLAPYLSMEYLRNNIAPTYVPIKECPLKAHNGDILLLWDGSNAGEFVISKEGLVSSTMAKLKPNIIINNNFSKYVCKAFEPLLRELTIGMGVPHVSSLELNNISLPHIPLDEQQQIAYYLDKKTARIDATIAKNEELIQLLEEKRVALINEVVTKGLNPDVAMKDSGVEWIGEIPEHWNISFLKRFAYSVSSGKTKNVEENGKYPLHGSTGVIGTTNSLDYNGTFILIARVGAYAGKTHIAKGKIGITDNTLIVDYTSQINYKFLYYILTIYDFKTLTMGSGQPLITGNDVKNIKITIPPLNEQKDIAYYLDDEISKIDIIISKINRNISLLEEYKTSLIHHVVTGKIDVRGEEI